MKDKSLLFLYPFLYRFLNRKHIQCSLSGREKSGGWHRPAIRFLTCGSALRAGEEVIVEGVGLYDGQLLEF